MSSSTGAPGRQALPAAPDAPGGGSSRDRASDVTARAKPPSMPTI